MKDGRSSGDDGPERLCLVTRQVKPPHEMIRFVVGPDETLVPDLKARLPGRGAWVTAEAAMVREAVRRKAFARSLKTPVTVSATLDDEVDRLLERDALQALSFVNKAGEALTGFFKAEVALSKGKVVALLNAREAAADGVRKLDQAAHRHADRSRVQIIRLDTFSSDDLSLALGTPHVIHAALTAGPASTGFLARWRRLSRFRGSQLVDTTGGPDEPGEPEADDLHGRSVP